MAWVKVHHLGRRSGRLVVLPCLVGASTLAGLAIAGVWNSGASTNVSQPAPLTQQQWEQGQAQLSSAMPQLLLPADQRALWIEDFQNMANCYHDQGIADFPNAPATFGDGNTPMPLLGGPPGSDMDLNSATYQAASAVCHFDSSNLSPSAFAQAWQQWNAAHPGNGTSQSPIPGLTQGTPQNPGS